MRVVIAEDLALLRDGPDAAAARRTASRSSPRSTTASARGRRRGPHARRLRRRRPPAADVHRRGHARRARGAPRGIAGPADPRPLPVRRADATRPSCSPTARAASATCSRTASPTSRDFVDAVRRVADGRHGARPRGRRPAARRPRRRRPARRAHPARARGARADGRGPLERGDRRARSSSPTARSRSTSSNIFRKLGLPPVRRRPPPRARRARLPARLTPATPAAPVSNRGGARRAARATVTRMERRTKIVATIGPPPRSGGPRADGGGRAWTSRG